MCCLKGKPQSRPVHRLIVAVTQALIFSVFGLPANAQPPSTLEASPWLTGKQLDDFTSQIFSVSWRDAPLKKRLTSFSKQQRVAVFVDRRIDPTTKISISIQDATIEQFLWTVARQQDWGVCRIDDFYYIGPKKTAWALPVLWQQMKKETRTQKRIFEVAWNKKNAFRLPDLSVPSEILQQLATENQFQIAGEELPHDLWSAVNVPPLPLDGQIALLIVGFDKWFRRSKDGKTVELIEFQVPTTGKMSFGPFENSRDLVREFRDRFPKIRISTSGKSFTASGPPEQLAAIKASILDMAGPRPTGDSTKRYTLTTSSSRGNILASIAKLTGTELDFEPALRETLSEHIQISVTDATLEVLLENVLRGTNANATISGGSLRISKSR